VSSFRGDTGGLRALTNDHQDLRLVSLRTWKGAPSFDPRDDSGPYMIGQEGYDPEDPGMVPHRFVLGKSGAWLRVSDFFRLGPEPRRREYVFGTAAEVLELLMGLPLRPAIRHLSGEDAAAAPSDVDGLGVAFEEGRAGEGPLRARA
jgi:hypothetical protein